MASDQAKRPKSSKPPKPPATMASDQAKRPKSSKPPKPPGPMASDQAKRPKGSISGATAPSTSSTSYDYKSTSDAASEKSKAPPTPKAGSANTLSESAHRKRKPTNVSIPQQNIDSSGVMTRMMLAQAMGEGPSQPAMTSSPVKAKKISPRKKKK